MSSEVMLQFAAVKQQLPTKRSALERKKDFREIATLYDEEHAQTQASRCEQCGVPYCQIHCPLGNNIPDWLMLAANNRMEEAYQLSQNTNNFPEICGRICPQDKLCEGNCVVEQSGHDYVTIGSIEKYITEHAFEQQWVKPIIPLYERDEHVAIIGAGPAGLAAAMDLRKKGLQVTIFDRYDRIGGLLIYGIPGFKLEKSVITRRADLLIASNINFMLNHDVTHDFKNIKAQYNAVLIATGTYKAHTLDITNDADNIIPALQFLTRANRLDLGDTDDNPGLSAKGKKIVVIGGGDTAMDCVRTSIRQGASSVTCLYRRDKDNMPGSSREVINAEAEGVSFMWLSTPKQFVMSDNKIEQIIIQKMMLDKVDATGRASIIPIEGALETIDADMVIMALGYTAENIPQLFNDDQLPVTKWGTIKTRNDGGQTAIDNVFAAGDIVRGASLVVWAIKDGQDAAKAIEQYLQ